MPTIRVHVRTSLFVPPERWSSIYQGPDAKVVRFSKAFKRKLSSVVLMLDTEQADLLNFGFAETMLPRWAYVKGLPVFEPLPYGREPNVYRVKALGYEGGDIVVHLA